MTKNTPNINYDIEIQNLSYRYSETISLEGINLNVPHGDFLGIIGPNGGGKTTLLKCIVGILNGYKGQIKIQGQNNKKMLKAMGYVPQHSTFLDDFPASVEEVVTMGSLGEPRLFGWFRKRDKEKADAIVELVGLKELIKRRVGQLSGGERQRLMIARALVNDPQILLLDEPTASLDTSFGQDLYELLLELNKTITIILVSHDIGVISRYVKTIACVNRRLFTEGTKEISEKMLEQTYKCPVDLIAHGVPHRVFPVHDHSSYHVHDSSNNGGK